MTAKTRIMLDNHPKPVAGSNGYCREQGPPRHETILPFTPALAECQTQDRVHVITPVECKPEPQGPNPEWDNLNLFGQAMEANEDYASVPIFNDFATRHSHDFMDSEDDLEVPTKEKVCIVL